MFFCFLVFFGGFKGQVRWPEGPPHLALNPPYWFLFLCFYFVFSSGFKGQVRWPKGPPHLALNPPYLFFCFVFVFFFSILSLLPIDKKYLFFLPRKGHFLFIVSASLCFPLAFFGLPLFQFLFLSLSLVFSPFYL